MPYKTILLSKLLETDLLFDNMGTHNPLVESSILSGPPKNSLVMNHAPKLWVG